MRKLTAQDSIQIIRADIPTRDVITDKLCGIMPQVRGDMLRRLTDEGFLHAAIVQIDGVDRYGVWYHYTIDGGCHLNYAVQLTEQPTSLPDLALAVETGAKERGCSYVQFTTERAGLVEQAQALGYVSTGLQMRKQL